MFALVDGPLRWVRSWDLWSVPRHVLTYVLIIDALALAATGATARLLPLTHTDWIRFAILAVAAIAYAALSRNIERARDLANGTGPFVDSLTVWDFTAIIVLPPVLACALIMLVHSFTWVRIWRGQRPLYRWLFSDATVLLATQAAGLVLFLGPGPHPGIPFGLIGLGVIVAAATVRWFINYALVVGVILASKPGLRASQIMGEFSEQILEAGALGLGIAAAGLLEFNPFLLVGVVISLIALHRGVLLAQFRRSSRTDDKTGLHSATWWHQIAQHALEQARAASTSLAILMLDLDHFKKINDTHGHLAGDDVLRAVAKAITTEVRRDDATGRWGGEEFVVLLTAVDVAELATIAERIRRHVGSLAVTITADHGPGTVQDLTISIGGALYPSPGLNTLDDLLLAADSALYAAKQDGRDRVHLPTAPPVGSPPPQRHDDRNGG